MLRLNKLFATEKENYTLLFLRIVAAVVMFPHGAQKLFGWFGGYGVEGTLAAFSTYSGIPPVLGFLNILAESVGAIILLFGLFTRISAFGLAVTMIVATFSVHLANGFFMNWTGAAAGEGFEYHILYFAITLILLVKGGGAYAADSVIAEKIGASTKENYSLKSAH